VRITPPGSSDRRKKTEALKTGSEPTRTILLVEDSGIVRDLVRQILEMDDYTVLEAPSPEDAIRICGAHEGEIHLLLTDVLMPGMNGRELSARVTILRPSVKVLYMSGYAEDVIVRNGVQDSGTHFIQKPFSAETLAEKVREVLAFDG
jgi:CheY-like chemotaxis protein